MNVLQCEECRATSQRPGGWLALHQILHDPQEGSAYPGGMNSLASELAATFCGLNCAASWLTARALEQGTAPPGREGP